MVLVTVVTTLAAGMVEADETYVLRSFKGQRKGVLSANRPARHRGGKARQRGLSREQVPILVARNRAGQTTVDMANGPVQRTQPYPDTIKLLEGLGAKNNHKCVSC